MHIFFSVFAYEYSKSDFFPYVFFSSSTKTFGTTCFFFVFVSIIFSYCDNNDTHTHSQDLSREMTKTNKEKKHIEDAHTQSLYAEGFGVSIHWRKKS